MRTGNGSERAVHACGEGEHMPGDEQRAVCARELELCPHHVCGASEVGRVAHGTHS